jgi:hypothetical protein
MIRNQSTTKLACTDQTASWAPGCCGNGNSSAATSSSVLLRISCVCWSRGHGGALYVGGEPGIGKTALIGEILERGHRRGYVTLSGRGAEFERELPFGVFADALEHHLRSSTRADLGLLANEELALLAMIFPSLGSLMVGEPAAGLPDQRHRLLRARRKTSWGPNLNVGLRRALYRASGAIPSISSSSPPRLGTVRLVTGGTER